MTSLTAADRALELFRNRPPVENAIDWLANQLLALASESGRLSLQIVPGGEGKGPVLESTDGSHVVSTQEPGPLRLFRTVLARFAKLAEEENGTPFNPYGGSLHFDRPGSGGPVRLNVELGNTTQVQSMAITKRA